MKLIINQITFFYFIIDRIYNIVKTIGNDNNNTT
jgi:hypothetical protein